jgi:radical SAM protein with 4Fe4S-binding SPASM domain
MFPTARATMAKLRYMHRLYGGMREARLAWTPEDDMAALSFPRLVQLQTLNACQASCVMCPWPEFRDLFPRGRMDDDLFDRIAEEVASRPEARSFVPMLQNEPFLDKRLFDRIARFRAMAGHRVQAELVTNGAFLTDENIARIRDVELDVLDISLDALHRETYARIRKGLDYDAVLAGVERVLAADLPHTKVFVRLVRQAENAREVGAFIRSWQARGVSVFVYTANNRTGAVREWDDRVGYREDSASAPVQLVRRVGRAAMRTYVGGCCPVAFATTNILHDGTMLLCVHDWGRREVIGNVRDASIAELWNGPRMREIRRMMVERRYGEIAPCSECTLARDGWV